MQKLNCITSVQESARGGSNVEKCFVCSAHNTNHMKRRQFIRISGTSLGSLLFVKNDFAFNAGVEQVAMPAKVAVQTDDGLHYLTRAYKQVYTYKNITVDLRYSGNALRVIVQSPKAALHNVQLTWRYAPSKNARGMGDHWERTYGDISFDAFSPKRKLPWYFIQHDDKEVNCFGVKTGSNSICHWLISDGALQLTMDTRNGGSGVLLGDRLLHSADIITTKNKGDENVFATASRFCKMMCPNPRLPKQPVYGINDWYFAYGNNSYDLILQHTSMMADLVTDTNNRPFSVVDAGWAKYSPLLPGDCCFQDDFSTPNDKFKDMTKLAEEIRKLGMRPALWTRPLCAAHDDEVNLLLPSIPGRDNPKNPVFDPTIPENMERILYNISSYEAWGYEMVKHDFTTYDLLGKWGFQMENDITTKGWHFNDRSRTNAEIILNLYSSIRKEAREMYLIGCNTVGHLSAGLFELNRIGDDTSGKEWERTKKMGVNTLGFRMIQHNNFYSADGDCVGLTKDVPWNKNKQWMQLLAQSSTPLFISAQPDALGQEQRTYIKECFANAAKEQPIAEPLDWLTNPFPSKWKLDGNVTEFDWS